MKVLIEQVLAAWREADRVASEQRSGSPQHAAAVAAVEHLRDAYAAVTMVNRLNLTGETSAPQPTGRVPSPAPDEA